MYYKQTVVEAMNNKKIFISRTFIIKDIKKRKIHKHNDKKIRILSGAFKFSNKECLRQSGKAKDLSSQLKLNQSC